MKKVLAQLFLSFFLCSFALAEALTLTHRGSIIPGGNNNSIGGFDRECKDINGTLIDVDSSQDPYDVTFSPDGTQVFIANRANSNTTSGNPLRMNRLDTPFDITSDRIKGNVNSDCNDLAGANPNDLAGGDMTFLTVDHIEKLHISPDGRIFFILNTIGKIGKYNLSKAYDINTMVYERNFDTGAVTVDSMAFNRDGTKLYTFDVTADVGNITTYSLPGPFDISSQTSINVTSMMDIGVIDEGSAVQGFDIEFTPDGGAMFILIKNGQSVSNGDDPSKQLNWIYQFRLGTNYDVSTAVKVGRYQLDDIFITRNAGDRVGEPVGMEFSHDGMRLYLTDHDEGGPAVHHIHQFDLECPYGIIECVTDPVSIIGSTVQLSKENINLNVSTIFKRFEWVKRNRDSENLNSFNINVKTFNPVLTSLKSKLKESKYIRQASITNNKKSNRKSTWSYWSHGDISIGRYEDTPIEKPKKITTSGITFGADRKFAEDKFFGLAIRYAESGSGTNSPEEIDMESLTLNLYGIAPGDEQRYINAVIGLSLLRFDHKYESKLTGERNGKQLFTAINFRNKETYGDFNITPSGRITYGLTHLSDFTNYISTVRRSTDVLYEEDVFENAEIAAGFLFDLKEYNFDGGRVNTNGGLEAVYDFTPDVKLEHSSQGSTLVNTVEIDNYSEKNLRANLGFETVYLNGFTFSFNYERFQHLDSHRFSHTDSLLIKLGHIKEEDSEFAFNFDPLINNLVKLSYVKDLHGFDLKLNSSYNFDSPIPEHGTDIEVSTSF
tara:strand:- start:224 stop:2554 length:2331 start_codon:yes stop_codon:yes gene_type:complete